MMGMMQHLLTHLFTLHLAGLAVFLMMQNHLLIKCTTWSFHERIHYKTTVVMSRKAKLSLITYVIKL